MRPRKLTSIAMKFLQNYFSLDDSDCESSQLADAEIGKGVGIKVSAHQGDQFAKKIANDFNPIHDHDSKRFCVPGDLLFAIALSQYGICSQMNFRFSELLKADRVLYFPERSGDGLIEVRNRRDRVVLEVTLEGNASTSDQSKEQLARSYVRFSGENFPQILLPLMREHQVMFNPQRPLVIYEQMSLSFEQTQFTDLSIELGNTYLEVEGKRGNAWLEFNLMDQGKAIGTGRKKLVLSGLRPYDEAAMKRMCEAYEARSLKG